MDFPRLVVLEPRHLWWEKYGVFNPAVVEIDGRIHLLYRAVGSDHISRFGLAVSDSNGEHFDRLGEPILEGDATSGWERLGMEDPRATVIGRDIFITYTAASVYPAIAKVYERSDYTAASVYPATFRPPTASPKTPDTPWRTRVSALRTRDLRSFKRLGVIINGLDSKDAVLLPRKHLGFYWLIHRISPGIYISRSKDLKRWEGNLEIMAPKESWELLKVGAGCPPMETEDGYLLLYHGVSKSGVYAVGAALLAKENPAVVLRRTKRPLLEPRYSWEKHGMVSNVVFPTGSVLRRGSVYLYYGAADRVVGLAKIPLSSILSALDE